MSSLRPFSSSAITISLPKPGRGKATPALTYCTARSCPSTPPTACRRNPRRLPDRRAGRVTGGRLVCRFRGEVLARTGRQERRSVPRAARTVLAALANQRRLEAALGRTDKLAHRALHLANLLEIVERVLGVVHIDDADHDFLPARAVTRAHPCVSRRPLPHRQIDSAPVQERAPCARGRSAAGTCFLSKWYSHSMSVWNLGSWLFLIHSVCPSICAGSAEQRVRGGDQSASTDEVTEQVPINTTSLSARTRPGPPCTRLASLARVPRGTHRLGAGAGVNGVEHRHRVALARPVLGRKALWAAHQSGPCASRRVRAAAHKARAPATRRPVPLRIA